MISASAYFRQKSEVSERAQQHVAGTRDRCPLFGFRTFSKDESRANQPEIGWCRPATKGFQANLFVANGVFHVGYFAVFVKSKMAGLGMPKGKSLLPFPAQRLRIIPMEESWPTDRGFANEVVG